jgi:hypothetical protein
VYDATNTRAVNPRISNMFFARPRAALSAPPFPV